jgi:hypothetical protein
LLRHDRTVGKAWRTCRPPAKFTTAKAAAGTAGRVFVR